MLTTVAAGRTYDFSHAVGGLYMPQPVAVAPGVGDTVYVLSRQYEQILDVPWNKTATAAQVNKFSVPTSPYDEEFLGRISRYGDAEGELIWPCGIAINSSGDIYITDEWMNRVSAFNDEGDLQAVWGIAGGGDGELNRPAGIAIDADDDVFIVDSLNHRVQKFSADGEYLSQFGRHGDADGEFNSPWGIAIDADGCLYVADHKNHRVQKFSADGEYLLSFGGYGKGRGKLNRPSDVAVDPDGDVYVCDWGNDRVQAYASDGKFIASLVGDAQRLAKWHQEQVDANADVVKARRRVYTLEPEWRFAMPTGVAFDAAKSRLLVTDTQRGRLQIYNKVSGYMEPQFNL